MSKNILLINPIPSGGIQTPFPVLPLGLACIAAVAKKCNTNVYAISGSEWQEKLVGYLQKFRPDIVGFQTFINNMNLCSDGARLVKEKYPDTRIVLGGVQVSNDPETALSDPLIDCVITGEAEAIFQNLLMEPELDYQKVPGVLWLQDNGTVKRNPGGHLVENLDDLPEIPYKMFYGEQPTPVGHLLTHRGCPHHCSHCPLKFRAGVPIRSHSTSRILKTINELIDNHGISFIEFYDENFTMHRDIISDLCKELESLPIRWTCTARINEVDKELGQKMAASGCESIVFGLGTGVQRLQKILGTNEDLEKAVGTIDLISQTGIKPIVVFSMGLPTETLRDFKNTVAYAFSLKAWRLRFEPAAPVPGSQLYELAQSGGRFLIKDWSEYRHPSQIVYIPAGWSLNQFRCQMLIAKAKNRIRRMTRVIRNQ